MAKPKLERNLHVPDDLIKELLTHSEVRMIKQRLHIIQLLEEGLSIRKVAEKAKVGTDTVVRMIRKLENNPRIREFMKNPANSSSKWIFGQVNPEE